MAPARPKTLQIQKPLHKKIVESDGQTGTRQHPGRSFLDLPRAAKRKILRPRMVHKGAVIFGYGHGLPFINSMALLDTDGRLSALPKDTFDWALFRASACVHRTSASLFFGENTFYISAAQRLPKIYSVMVRHVTAVIPEDFSSARFLEGLIDAVHEIVRELPFVHSVTIRGRRVDEETMTPTPGLLLEMLPPENHAPLGADLSAHIDRVIREQRIRDLVNPLRQVERSKVKASASQAQGESLSAEIDAIIREERIKDNVKRLRRISDGVWTLPERLEIKVGRAWYYERGSRREPVPRDYDLDVINEALRRFLGSMADDLYYLTP